MKHGYLSRYFKGVAYKRLRKVEVNHEESHQHEFNGPKGFVTLFGEPSGKVSFDAVIMHFKDEADEPLVDHGFMTWYDARKKGRLERGVNRSEYRLYFSSNALTRFANEGDLLLIALKTDGSLLAIVAAAGSTAEQQLAWLFGLHLDEVSRPDRFSLRSDLDSSSDRLSLFGRLILEQIGVDAGLEDDSLLERMLERFHGGFPATAVFSEYARTTLPAVSSRDDPDAALIAWMEREEVLFRTLERHLLRKRLIELVERGLQDPDEMLATVQSALQRRKSRAGAALENHLEKIFNDYKITYTRTGVTEGRRKPDFIFPGIARYHDSSFPATSLTMLAAKSTCKDRWRQILNEADRIPVKHLLTLEPGISTHQTDEMKEEGVRLVLPSSVHESYTADQQTWLMDVRSFLLETSARQSRPE